jgi:hypothetical protein
MKKFLNLLAVTCLAVTAQAQFGPTFFTNTASGTVTFTVSGGVTNEWIGTNGMGTPPGTPIHSWPTAAAPLLGTELVPMSQLTSGTNATKICTVAQIQSLPLTFAEASSNFFLLATQTLTLNQTIISITVSQLGRHTYTGSSAMHELGLWDASGTLLAAVTVNPTGIGTGWLYGAISPVVLTAGQIYYVGGYEGGGDPWDDCTSDTYSVTSAASEVYTAYIYDGTTFAWPSTAVVGGAMGGFNFLYQ